MNWKKLLPLLGLLLAVLLRAAETSTIVRRVMPNDIISIRVLNEADLTQDRRIPADGKITFPYLEVLDVKDKTTGEIEKMIHDGLHPDWIIHPQVTVEIKDYVKQFVNVSGQVNQPGPVELPPDRRLDILEIIGRARDFTPRANKDKIELTRKGVAKPFIYTEDELRKQTDPDKKVYVEPDDQIFVRESRF
jgi:protein involved in polysaccharide export with SLBB domain